MQRIQLRPVGSDAPIDVTIERSVGDTRDVSVLIGDRRVDVRLDLADSRSGCLHVHGRVLPFHAVRRKEMIELWIDGRTWRFEVPQRTARRMSAGASATVHRHLAAPMPGTVLKVNAKAGAAFEAHQPLVVMESMKMEMTLSAPHAGRVAEVCCTDGQLVEMGAVLMRFVENDG